MSNNALMGELRSLLAQGPSCFPALCHALHGAPAHVVSYVQDHVDGWPALTRRMPVAWFELGPDERSLWGLCDVVCLREASTAWSQDAWLSFLGAPELHNVRALDLSRDNVHTPSAPTFGALVMRALVQSSSLRRLTHLDLTGTGVTAAALRELVPWVERLRVLELGANDLTADDLAGEFEGAAPGLWALNLEDNRLGDAGAALLARASWTSGLWHLNLGYNEIGDAGALALAASPALASLETLNLWCNEIGEDGQRALRARFGGLDWLQLADNAPDGPVEHYP